MKNSNSVSKLIMVLAIAAGLFAGSCRKKEEPMPEPEPQPDTEQSTAVDNTIAEMIANDLEAIGSQASENDDLTTYRMTAGASGILSMAPCATVSMANSIITVDFGTIGCLGADGRIRSGKLFYDFSAAPSLRYRNPGYDLTVSSQNFVVDGHQVTVNSKRIRNTTPVTIPTGTNPGTNLTWSVTANITIVKSSNTGTINWTCNRTKELVNTNDTACYHGQATPITWTQAVVKLNGTASGTNARSETYSATAVDLIRDFRCTPDVNRPHRHPFVSGTINYVPANRPARLIDYGSATNCDLLATVTINGKIFNITLP
jgi:hypothetical protein